MASSKVLGPATLERDGWDGGGGEGREGVGWGERKREGGERWGMGGGGGEGERAEGGKRGELELELENFTLGRGE